MDLPFAQTQISNFRSQLPWFTAHQSAQQSNGTAFRYPFFASAVYGTNQFAYRRFHGARDAILFVLLSWRLALVIGKKIGVYCGDVSGAFDRVSTSKLLLKLGRSIIPRCIVRVIADWLVGRRGEVIVQGCSSDSFPLSMTYHGTVWGPSLWNLFFADSPLAVR